MVSVIIDMACSSSMQLNIYERNLVLRHTEGIMQFTMSLLLMTAIILVRNNSIEIASLSNEALSPTK
jgi:hypothetical protein